MCRQGAGNSTAVKLLTAALKINKTFKINSNEKQNKIPTSHECKSNKISRSDLVHVLDPKKVYFSHFYFYCL